MCVAIYKLDGFIYYFIGWFNGTLGWGFDMRFYPGKTGDFLGDRPFRFGKTFGYQSRLVWLVLQTVQRNEAIRW